MFLAIGGVSLPREVAAQTTADVVTAQGLFDDARALMDKGQYAAACPKLEESQRLDPGGGTLLNLAACYEHQGRLASAWSRFLEAASVSKTAGNADRESAARERAAQLAPRLPRILIHVTADTASGLEVRRNGSVVGRAQWGTAIPADPGSHSISAAVPGKTPWKTTVVLKEGTTTTIAIPDVTSPSAGAPGTKGEGVTSQQRADVAPAEGTSRSGLGTQRIVALTAGGIGVAGLVVGTVFFFQSKSKHDESQEHCTGADCRDQIGVDLSNQAKQAGDVATAAYVVGAVGLAAGAVLWFTAPRSSTQVALGLGTVQIRATW